jgi:hypothetical protein
MNFPVVPVTDLIIKDNDLVAATAEDHSGYWMILEPYNNLQV